LIAGAAAIFLSFRGWVDARKFIGAPASHIQNVE
jgi:hypothetical protein